MIETTGLRKKFGDFVAVHDLNLHVPAGVIFGLLGPNGSGKSTTVKMLTGILKPSAGDSLIDGSLRALEVGSVAADLPGAVYVLTFSLRPSA